MVGGIILAMIEGFGIAMGRFTAESNRPMVPPVFLAMLILDAPINVPYIDAH